LPQHFFFRTRYKNINIINNKVIIISDLGQKEGGKQMKKIVIMTFVICIVLSSMSSATTLPLQKNNKIQQLLPQATTTMENQTPPDWAKGNFSGVWGITVLGVPAAPSGWITGYYQNIGFGKLEAVYADFNHTNATAYLNGFMVWIFFLGGTGNLPTGNVTWVTGIGVANQTHFYWRINAIIGPSFYIHCQYTKFENVTKTH
jgi:hypothetical protein